MDSPATKIYTTAQMLEDKRVAVLSALDALRAEMEDFYSERGITGIDVKGMSASDLIKHVKIVVLTCSTPVKRKI